jgi:hypothetical protein
MDLAANTPGRSNVASMLLQLKRDDSNSGGENSKIELANEDMVSQFDLSELNI